MDIYKSQETFEFNGKTYNKVLVTSSWNNIAVRQFGTSFYNEYTIPEGSYDYNELVTEIVNVFNQFFIDNNISGSVKIDKFKFNSTGTGTLINSLLYPIRYVELVAMENGLQKILPFTVPIMYCHNKDYDNYINSAKNQQNWYIFIFDDIFDMVWLNELFLETTETYNISYPNCFLEHLVTMVVHGLKQMIMDLLCLKIRMFTIIDVIYQMVCSMYMDLL